MLQLHPYSWQGETGDIRDKATGQLFFRRSKTLCSDNADWVTLENTLDGTTAWRIQARYSDRDVHDEGSDGYWTALRVFYGNAETLPRFMLFYRSKDPGPPQSGCSIDVYQGNVQDPGGAKSMFRLQCNDRKDTVGIFPLYSGEERSLATLRMPAEFPSMTIEMETGVDPSLLTALLIAADQLLLSHKLHDYNVDWKGDLWLLEACAGTPEARKPGDRRPPAPDKRTGCLCLGSLR